MRNRLFVAVVSSVNILVASFALASGTIAGEDALEFFVDKVHLVESTTRSAKQVSQVPENVTVITQAEIRAMNAHSVAEVLSRVTGVMVESFGQDFGSLSEQHIQGSKPTHVLVLLDEMPINWLSGGNSTIATIPVEIIDRIEIVKGPASSTWGSALGGVINIITAEPTKEFSGTAYATVAEHNSTDLRGAVSGLFDGLGYYLYAGYQHSDGLALDRHSDNPSLFAKITKASPSGLSLAGSVGLSKPQSYAGDLVAAGVQAHNRDKLLFANLAADYPLSASLSAHATAYVFRNIYFQDNDEDGQYGPKGSNFKDLDFDERQQGANARLHWRTGNQDIVAGVDYNRGELVQTNIYGDYLQSVGAPAKSRMNPELSRWGAYLNDTITLGDFTLVPGLRFDSHSIAGEFWSPSLGVAYRASSTTTLRVTAARGFTSPALSDLSGGGLFYDPNPDLKPETVQSVQLGVETTALSYLWLKASLFNHDLAQAHTFVPSPASPTNNTTTVNGGRIRRTGVELEFETAPIAGATLYGGTCYAVVRPSGDARDQDLYTANFGIKYRSELVNGDLNAHREGWDIPDDGFKGRYDDTILTLILSRDFHLGEKGVCTLLGAAHNILNGNQYSTITFPNPGPWAEVSVRYNF